MAKSGLKILYGEGDSEAQAGTAVAFEKAGHSVEKALGRKAVEAALHKGSFHLVVLGPTLSRNDRHHLPYMVKKAHAETSVLVMHADGSRHPYVDACTDTGTSTEGVLARIEGMKIAGMMPAAAAAAAGGR
jgi:DNA-binding NtrC family response regulator